MVLKEHDLGWLLLNEWSIRASLQMMTGGRPHVTGVGGVGNTSLKPRHRQNNSRTSQNRKNLGHIWKSCCASTTPKHSKAERKSRRSWFATYWTGFGVSPQQKSLFLRWFKSEHFLSVDTAGALFLCKQVENTVSLRTDGWPRHSWEFSTWCCEVTLG